MSFNSFEKDSLVENSPLLPQSIQILKPIQKSLIKPILIRFILFISFASTFYVYAFRSNSIVKNTLQFHPCPDITTTLCAYHSVPMDWTSPENGQTVSLAIRVLPATVPVKDQLGYLFINPGGPGGSGTDLLLRAGKSIQTIVTGRYNIISWDPRGVNLTTPPLDCFSNAEEANRFARDIEHLGLPFEVGGPDNDLKAEQAWAKKIDAFTVALDGTCTQNGNQEMLSSSSTAFVVRDIVSMLDALGEKNGLNYWGFSYGTILGATFAAMFPELINRVLLDGVSDASLYTNNLLDWGVSSMNDTYKTWNGFVDSCASSGPKGCAFAKHENTTSKEIQTRFNNIMIKLQVEPLAVSVGATGPGILGPSDVQYAVFHSLYKPKAWPALALALAELENNNGTLIYNMQNPTVSLKGPEDNPFHRSMIGSMASTSAIMCSDTKLESLQDVSSSSFLKYAKELGTISPTGEIWAVWVNSCKNWSSKAREAYRGPWTVADGFRKTNFPILFVSNTADPVTPLSAAITMAEGFGKDSASLLIQNGFGHCSSAHPGLETAKIARAYFVDGVVPEFGTTVDSDPGFLFPHPGEATFEVLSTEDQELFRALQVLSVEI